MQMRVHDQYDLSLLWVLSLTGCMGLPPPKLLGKNIQFDRFDNYIAVDNSPVGNSW